MADQVIAEVNGLQVSNGTFSASPPGSLQTAEECVMPQKGVIEPRRGQERESTTPTATQTPFAMVEFQGEIITNCGVDKADTSYDLALGSDEYSDGPFNPVDDDGSNESYGRMKFGQGGGYLYFCTTAGPKALESAGGDVRNAGLMPMPDVFASMGSASLLGANGVGLAQDSSRAYRSLLRRATSDGVSLLSPPSGRFVATNELVAEIGQMTRTIASGNLVTVTLEVSPGVAASDTFTLAPGESNFPAGTYTVVAAVGGAFTYNDGHVGVDATNTVRQLFETGPRPVNAFAYLPAAAVEGDFVRFYRSADTTTADPTDELKLVAEVAVSSSDVSNGYVQYLDTVPSSVISDPLYTNPLTGSSEAGANYPPPIYRDIAYWQERMWYANTTGLQSLRLQMIGVGGPDGVQNNDTITFTVPGASGSPFEFVFKTTAGGLPDVQIHSASTPAVNIQYTSLALIAAFQATMEGVDAPVSLYYLSGQDQSPGQMLLQATSYAQEAIGVKVSRPASWVPALDSTTDTMSVAEYVPNGVSYSKLAESEAVPLLNFTAVGSKNYPIARILGLQQSLLVFKEGDGIYTVSGSAPFQVQQVSTANIIAPDAAVVFADNAWCYTDQGILRISNSGGSTVVSRPIETDLNELRARFPDETHDWAFAVAYETERRVLFFVPFSVDSDGRPLLKAWCFNNATNAWTGPLYERGAFSGVASLAQNKLALGVFDEEFNTGRVTLERRGNGGGYDYADADFSNSITAIDVGGDPLVVTLSSIVDVEAGDGIVQGNYRTKIASLDGNNATLYEEVPFLATTCSIYKHYNVSLSFLPSGNPSARKTLTRLTWLAKPEWFASLTGKTTLLTDQIQGNSEVDSSFAGFGMNPFGTGTFGDPSPMVFDVNPLDPKWTNAAQFYPGFEVSEAWPKLKLQGFSAMIEQASGPAGRGK